MFVHISEFVNRSRRPKVNEVVRFQVKRDKQGRVQANRVSIAGDRTQRPTSAGSQLKMASAIAGVFLAVVAGTVLVGKLPLTVFLIYLAASGVTFIAYAWDKSAARTGNWRTSESTLHLFDLAGGWPGALIARHTFRHKSKKQSFIVAFWGTVLLNCAGFGWLLTDTGQQVLASLKEFG